MKLRNKKTDLWPAGAVDARKRARIKKAAQFFLDEYGTVGYISQLQVRFDVAEVIFDNGKININLINSITNGNDKYSYKYDKLYSYEDFEEEFDEVNLKDSDDKITDLPKPKEIKAFLEKDVVLHRDNVKDLFIDICDYIDYRISGTISSGSFYIAENDVQQIGEQLKEIYENLLMEEQEDDRY